MVYLRAKHKIRVLCPFLAVHRQESCNPTPLEWLKVGWAGSVPAEGMSCKMPTEIIAGEEIKNTPGRRNEWVPASFEVT